MQRFYYHQASAQKHFREDEEHPIQICGSLILPTLEDTEEVEMIPNEDIAIYLVQVVYWSINVAKRECTPNNAQV